MNETGNVSTPQRYQGYDFVLTLIQVFSAKILWTVV